LSIGRNRTIGTATLYGMRNGGSNASPAKKRRKRRPENRVVVRSGRLDDESDELVSNGGRRMKILRSQSILFLSILTLLGGVVFAQNKVTINALFMKQAGYSEDDTAAGTKDFEALNPNIHVELTFVPYEALEQKIITSAASGSYDVVLSDGPFTPKFAKAGIVRALPPLSSADLKDIFPGAIDASMYQGKLYGMPWLNDCKYLYVNMKMLKAAGFTTPPKTWDELTTQAKAIKAKGLVQYPIVWSWAQAEALMCDYTTLAASFGGGMIDKNGQPTMNTVGNKKALDFMYDGLKSGISNPRSLEFVEDDVKNTFAAGNAAFAINWTFAYSFAKDPTQSKVVNDFVLAVIPGNGKIVSATVNGGQPLSISAGTKHPDEAWKYIQYLSSKPFQQKYCQNALPIWKSLYTDKAVIASNPEVVTVSKTQYDYIVNRPQVPYYSEFSTDFQVRIQEVLLGKKTSDQALKEAQAKMVELAGKK
jgi:multiple sugar transport system substrate-binding protein